LGIHRIAERGRATDIGQPIALRFGADAAGGSTAVEGVDTERHEIDAGRPVRPFGDAERVATSRLVSVAD
jgi:hypothetical protein